MGKSDSFKPEILKTADGKEVVYYGVWDSCARPNPEDLVYSYEEQKTRFKIIATSLKNPRIHYEGTEQRMDRCFKLLIQKDDGKMEVMEAKFYRFKPVVKRDEEDDSESKKPVASVHENREELMKFTSKRMQRMNNARKRKAIGVGVDDALKLKELKVAESNIKRQSEKKKEAESEASPVAASTTTQLDPTRSIDELVKDIINNDAKTMNDLFNPEAIIPANVKKLLTQYVQKSEADSLKSPYFRDVFTKSKSDEDKALAVYADALVTISKIDLGSRYDDDPIEHLQEPQVKNELLKRFTEQTSAGTSSTRQRLKWLVTPKSKDLMTALVTILMYRLSGKKYISVNAVTKLLSISAKKVIRVASLMNGRIDRSGGGPDLYFDLPGKKVEEVDKSKKKKKRPTRAKAK